MEDQVNAFYQNHLFGECFHVTSLTSCEQIYQIGYIAPSGCNEPVFSQTSFSYAKRMGYVSIFDFAEPSVESILRVENTWLPIIARHNPITMVLLLNIESMLEHLIRSSALRGKHAMPGFVKKNYHVPLVEAWHDGSIPVSCVSGLVELNWRDRMARRISAWET